jgi:glucan phosphoethanolaminetransferase (alkaline phosphatase superfamily)
LSSKKIEDFPDNKERQGKHSINTKKLFILSKNKLLALFNAIIKYRKKFKQNKKMRHILVKFIVVFVLFFAIVTGALLKNYFLYLVTPQL